MLVDEDRRSSEDSENEATWEVAVTSNPLILWYHNILFKWKPL